MLRAEDTTIRGMNIGAQHSSASDTARNVSPMVERSRPARLCLCGEDLIDPSPSCRFAITPDALRSVSVPAGLTLVPGGSPHRPLELAALPRIDLTTRDSAAVLDMLCFAGVCYASPESLAASVGIRVFETGRALAQYGPYEAVTVDWDHTVSNYQIFEDLPRLIRIRRLASPPSTAASAAPLVAIEAARPFMIELIFGFMAGFAIRQGLSRLSEWARYQPRVGLATHTWPDRLGLAAQQAPILPLMEGLVPGAPEVYERMTSADVRSVIHLHHFLDYAKALVRRFDAHGFPALTTAEADELMRYLEDGVAHRRKPLGAWGARGWNSARLLHIDDSPMIIADLSRQAMLNGHTEARFTYAPHSHSRVFTNIREWHKISLPSLWRSRANAIRGVVAALVRMEWSHSAVPDLLRGLADSSEGGSIAWPEGGLPTGTVMTMFQTPTTMGEFWNYYVEPVSRAQSLLREVRRRHGGLRTIRRAWRVTARHRSVGGPPSA